MNCKGARRRICGSICVNKQSENSVRTTTNKVASGAYSLFPAAGIYPRFISEKGVVHVCKSTLRVYMYIAVYGCTVHVYVRGFQLHVK